VEEERDRDGGNEQGMRKNPKKKKIEHLIEE